jgi:hypothetical protein
MCSRSAAARLAEKVATATGFDTARVQGVLAGALLSTHDAHGSIGEVRATSVARRAAAQFRSDGLWRTRPR